MRAFFHLRATVTPHSPYLPMQSGQHKMSAYRLVSEADLIDHHGISLSGNKEGLSGLFRGWASTHFSWITRSIAKEVGIQPRIISLWRHRYADHGLEGLKDKPRPGKQPIYTKTTDKRILKLLDK